MGRYKIIHVDANEKSFGKKENFAIGSAIEAVPYNVRYCAKHFGFSRERLEKGIVGIGFIVLFLSCGAPNQPGSILIGMLIIFSYLNVEGTSVALCFELFCGSLQNIINVISGVVTIAENEIVDGKLS